MLVSFAKDIVPLFDNTSHHAMASGLVINPDVAAYNDTHKTEPGFVPIKPVMVKDIEGGPFDLHNLHHVRKRATRISTELWDRYNKSISPEGLPMGMPLPAAHMPAWTKANIELFDQWIADGMQP